MDFFRLGLFLLINMGVSADVQLQPLNAVVLSGSKARFNCSSTQATSAMTWTVNGLLVITIIEGSGVLNSTERFAVTNFTTPGNYKWELTISNVQRNDAGKVTCQVLGGESQVATLSVQERGSVEIIGGNQTKTEGTQTEFQCRAIGWYPEPNMSWSVNGVGNSCNKSSVTQGGLFNSSCTLTVTAVKNSSVQCLVTVPALNTPESNTVFLTVEKPVKRDQTVLIAITVAFSAAALLFLIIYGIVFFCKRRKKSLILLPTSLSVFWLDSSKSRDKQLDPFRRVQESSYQEEVRRARVQSQNRTPVTQDERGQDNRGYTTDGHDGHTDDRVWYTSYSNKHQMPQVSLEDGNRKHRHMTIV
ncbi:immunoglobulin superfamily member 5 isoform X1 [Pseudorasbora parva]|uniref:immunoglobulin superfamily member 5 isoform X1 n=1 Tax=Pseudorasbora parva TaxID=51549 RepID=UPI00351E9BE0